MNKGPTGKPTGTACKLRKLCASDPAAARVAIMAALESSGGHRGKAAQALRESGMLPERGDGIIDKAYARLCACVRELPGLREEIDGRWPGSSRGGHAWTTRRQTDSPQSSEKIA